MNNRVGRYRYAPVSQYTVVLLKRTPGLRATIVYGVLDTGILKKTTPPSLVVAFNPRAKGLVLPAI